ncbi:MAG: AraC family transcriptional regulator [Clostridia bacterium]|nr:AraC family transcriptional regulator [Clostridia bacterium]
MTIASDNRWISKNIFIKCLYSAHHTVSGEWYYSDEKTNYCNLVLICSGTGFFTCENIETVVKRGDLVFFPSGVKRSMRADGETLEFRSFNFRYRLLFEHKTDWWIENPPLPLEFVRHIDDKVLFTKLEQLFAHIQRHYTTLQYEAAFQMRFYATEILSLLLSDLKQEISYSEKNITEKSIAYMSEHFTEKITLKELASIAKKSVSYYGKIFKKVHGVTPIDYLLSIRISYAKKLLENGSSVTETALLCGFSNVYYFSKAFRCKENMSPSEYRNSH